jgi:hypothetical protein
MCGTSSSELRNGGLCLGLGFKIAGKKWNRIPPVRVGDSGPLQYYYTLIRKCLALCHKEQLFPGQSDSTCRTVEIYQKLRMAHCCTVLPPSNKLWLRNWLRASLVVAWKRQNLNYNGHYHLKLCPAVVGTRIRCLGQPQKSPLVFKYWMFKGQHPLGLNREKKPNSTIWHMQSMISLFFQHKHKWKIITHNHIAQRIEKITQTIRWIL